MIDLSILFSSVIQPSLLWRQRFLDFLGNLVAQVDPVNGSKTTKLHR